MAPTGSGGHVLITGFGAFAGVDDNPSGRVAEALDGEPLGGERGSLTLRGRLLPVTFRGAPDALEAAFEELRPVAILATGVHRGPSFRLERRAAAGLKSDRPDNDGVQAQDLGLARETSPGPGTDLFTRLDLAGFEEALQAAGAKEVTRSDDAGGYVCECAYRRVLEIAEREGVPGLFLHVPPLALVSFDESLPLVRAAAHELARQVGISAAAPRRS